MHGRGHAWQGVCAREGGICGREEGICGRGTCIAGETVTEVGSTYWNAFLFYMIWSEIINVNFIFE